MTFQENLRHYREKAGYTQAKDFRRRHRGEVFDLHRL